MKTTPWELRTKKLIQIDGEPFFEKRKKSASHPTDLFAFAIHCVVNSSQQLKDVEHIAPSPFQLGGVKKTKKDITFYSTSEKSETPPPPSKSTLIHHGEAKKDEIIILERNTIPTKKKSAIESTEGQKDHHRSASPPSTSLESYHNHVNLETYEVDMIT